MKPHRSTWMAASAFLLAAIASFVVAPGTLRAQTRWGANYFPNTELTTQNGDVVHFYDLIKGKTVAIELMFTSCEYNCPLETARLAQVQKLLGSRMGKDVFFYSITIDPKHDTSEVLKAYADQYRAGPGWLFLTGKPEDIELLSKKLGLYSRPNPDNKDGHMPELLIGNEGTGQWTRDSALDNPRFIAQMIGNWMNNWQTAAPDKDYAAARPPVKAGTAEYLFSTRCAACHTIGGGESVGPDLANVLAQRDRAWMTRYVLSPTRLRGEGDPIARTLFQKYPAARMPNLNLSEQEAAEVLTYVASKVPRPTSKRQ